MHSVFHRILIMEWFIYISIYFLFPENKQKGVDPYLETGFGSLRWVCGLRATSVCCQVNGNALTLLILLENCEHYSRDQKKVLNCKWYASYILYVQVRTQKMQSKQHQYHNIYKSHNIYFELQITIVWTELEQTMMTF